jgi:hypothetical protein
VSTSFVLETKTILLYHIWQKVQLISLETKKDFPKLRKSFTMSNCLANEFIIGINKQII